MPKVTFVLDREGFGDHLYGTGAWAVGETRDVTDQQWEGMRKHYDVWREAGAEPVTSDGELPSGKTADGNTQDTDPALAEANAKIAETLANLDALSDDEVRAFAKSLDVTLPGNIGPSKLRSKVREALAA